MCTWNKFTSCISFVCESFNEKLFKCNLTSYNIINLCIFVNAWKKYKINCLKCVLETNSLHVLALCESLLMIKIYYIKFTSYSWGSRRKIKLISAFFKKKFNNVYFLKRCNNSTRFLYFLRHDAINVKLICFNFTDISNKSTLILVSATCIFD